MVNGRGASSELSFPSTSTSADGGWFLSGRLLSCWNYPWARNSSVISLDVTAGSRDRAEDSLSVSLWEIVTESAEKEMVETCWQFWGRDQIWRLGLMKLSAMEWRILVRSLFRSPPLYGAWLLHKFGIESRALNSLFGFAWFCSIKMLTFPTTIFQDVPPGWTWDIRNKYHQGWLVIREQDLPRRLIISSILIWSRAG